jgi:hypothetical protein
VVKGSVFGVSRRESSSSVTQKKSSKYFSKVDEKQKFDVYCKASLIAADAG